MKKVLLVVGLMVSMSGFAHQLQANKGYDYGRTSIKINIPSNYSTQCSGALGQLHFKEYRFISLNTLDWFGK
jgi:hypothetical protein